MAEQPAPEEATLQRSDCTSTCLPESCPKLASQRAFQKLLGSEFYQIDKTIAARIPGYLSRNLRDHWKPVPEKTAFCRKFGTRDGCSWGDDCYFAHSEEELRTGQLIRDLAASSAAVEKSRGGLESNGFHSGHIAQADTCSDQGVGHTKMLKRQLCIYNHGKMPGRCFWQRRCQFEHHGEAHWRPLIASSSTTVRNISPSLDSSNGEFSAAILHSTYSNVNTPFSYFESGTPQLDVSSAQSNLAHLSQPAGNDSKECSQLGMRLPDWSVEDKINSLLLKMGRGWD